MAYFVLMCYSHSISSPGLTDFTYKLFINVFTA